MKFLTSYVVMWPHEYFWATYDYEVLLSHTVQSCDLAAIMWPWSCSVTLQLLHDLAMTLPTFRDLATALWWFHLIEMPHSDVCLLSIICVCDGGRLTACLSVNLTSCGHNAARLWPVRRLDARWRYRDCLKTLTRSVSWRNDSLLNCVIEHHCFEGMMY